MKPIVKSSIWCASFLAAGIGIGRWTYPESPTAGSAVTVSAPTKASRTGREAGERGPSVPAELGHYLDLLHTDNSAATMGTLANSLRSLPPGRLAALAAEMHELQRDSAFDPDHTALQELMLHAWTSADPRGALEFARTLPSRTLRAGALKTVFAVMGGKNAEEAITLARELVDPSERHGVMLEIAGAAARRDPARTMELFAGVTELKETDKIVILTELAKKDPVRAVEALSRISPNELEHSGISGSQVFRAWAARDPDAVLAWAETAPNLRQKEAAIRAAYEQFSTGDPAEALERMGKVPPRFRKQGLIRVIDRWADSDPQAALAAAAALSQPADREVAMETLARQIYHIPPTVGADMVLAMPPGSGRQDAIQALIVNLESSHGNGEKSRVLAKFEGLEHSKMAALIAPTMITEDVEAAIDLFSSIPPTERDIFALKEFTGALTELDPERAEAFARNLPSEADRSAAIRSFVHKLTYISPADAAARLPEIPDASERMSALTALARSWGRRDSAAALQWAHGLQGEEKIKVLPSLLEARAKDDPRDAGTQLRDLLENPGDVPASSLDQATRKVAREWAGRSPGDAARWVHELPEGDAEAAVLGMATILSKEDPATTTEWVVTLPEGMMKDVGIEFLAYPLVRDNPQAAFEWGLTITDATRRERLVTEVIQEWSGRDPDSVKAALEGAQLDPAEREKYDKLLR